MSGAIQQQGPLIAGHVRSANSNGVATDAGTAAAGHITEVGITNPGGLAIGINSGTISGPSTQMGFNVGGWSTRRT